VGWSSVRFFRSLFCVFGPYLRPHSKAIRSDHLKMVCSCTFMSLSCDLGLQRWPGNGPLFSRLLPPTQYFGALEISDGMAHPPPHPMMVICSPRRQASAPLSNGHQLHLTKVLCSPRRRPLAPPGDGHLCNTLCYEKLIKSFKLQLSHKARENQVV
jgi:hypothetical protein